MQTPISTEVVVRRVIYLDPTGHVVTEDRRLAGRLPGIKGTTAALLDNGNDTSGFFFNSLADILRQQYGVNQVILKTKFTSAKPADPDLLQDLAERADFMVAGVAL
jgi:hypothetical protein